MFKSKYSARVPGVPSICDKYEMILKTKNMVVDELLEKVNSYGHAAMQGLLTDFMLKETFQKRPCQRRPPCTGVIAGWARAYRIEPADLRWSYG
ncbi:hypothetical protein MTP99_019749 [Tenebrio molitor]|nr:hypothetical protein MTP99_019749 [Tenebrio molitor]